MNEHLPQRRVVLVRHGSVAERYLGVCYGRSDVELGDEGWQQTRELAARLSSWPITHLFHSGLSRTRELAELIGRATSATPITAPALQEFDFGDWELRTWEEIYTIAPDALDRLLGEPGTFSPPSGETMFALRDRVLNWHQALPPHGLIVAVAHGGSIAALRGTLAGLPVSQWPSLVPQHAEVVELSEPTCPPPAQAGVTG